MQAHPKNPNQFSRSVMARDRLWVNSMREKYEVELGQLDVPDGLRDDVVKHLDPVFGQAGEVYDLGIESEIAQAVNEQIAIHHEAVINTVITLIVTGRYESMPRELLGKIHVQEIPGADGNVVRVLHVMGGPLTDWRTLLKDAQEEADRLYGPPARGRRGGSDMIDFAQDARSRCKDDPGAIALEWIEADPVRYPLGELSEEYERLRENFRKILVRYPQKDKET